MQGMGINMDNPSNGYGQGMPRSDGGRLSASRNVQHPHVQRPSREDLAPYGAANYTSHGSKRGHRYTQRRHIIVAAIAAVVVLLLIIPGAALVINGKNAMNDARTLMNQGSALMSQIQSGDVQGAQRTATNLSSIAKQLDDNVGSPLWVPLTLIPVYGEDVRQIRTLANVASKLSEQVLIPITQGLPVEGSAKLFVNGGFNIPMIQAVLTPIGSASGVVQECCQQVSELGESHIAQLQGPLETVKGLMGMLDEVSGYAGDLAQVLPGVFGANGPRTYLIIACSESELRSVGGFPGSAGLLTMDNGKMDIGELVAPNLPFVQPEDDVIKLTDEERLLFGDRAGEYFYDAGYIPHFPRAAEIMKSIWDANGRPPIDGIISVDPTFLQSVMALTGAVTTSEGVVLDGMNAAEILMNSAYLMYSSESVLGEVEDPRNASLVAGIKQNNFFSEVASLALDSFFSNIGSANILKVAQTLGESIADKRIYMWVVNPDEQAVIEEVGAACTVSVNEAEPELGVYLATTVATKGNWYATTNTVVDKGIKNADGSTSYRVTSQITNSLSPDDVDALPSIITSSGYKVLEDLQIKSGMILDVYLFAPMGGTITDVQVEGSFAPETLFDFMGTWYTRPGSDSMTKTSYNNHEVWYGVTVIEPSQSTILTYTVTTSPNAIDSLKVDTTPLGQG